MSASPLLEEVVVFSLGRKAYAFPVGGVREVVQMVEATPMPSLPEAVLGVIDVRGELLPLVDMSTVVDQHPASISRNQLIVVIAARGRSWGVLVDSVEGVKTLELRLSRPDGRPSITRGLVADGSVTAVLLDPDEVIGALGLESDLLGVVVSG